LEKKNFVRKDQFLLTSFLCNIWQPPRVCWLFQNTYYLITGFLQACKSSIISFLNY
jgi:hypothetical protein